LTAGIAWEVKMLVLTQRPCGDVAGKRDFIYRRVPAETRPGQNCKIQL